MAIFAYEGSFIPSRLAQCVRATGIDCQGVTCTEDGTGAVTAVQIIVGDETDRPALDAAVAAYTPPPPPSDIATSADRATVSDQLITEKLASAPVTRDELPTILQNLLGEASSAIPYYEGYTTKPDPATAWTNFQALDQATKDRILYNACRSLGALVRYLSGDLPTS